MKDRFEHLEDICPDFLKISIVPSVVPNQLRDIAVYHGSLIVKLPDPAVYVNLDIEGESRLDFYKHESQFLIQVIVVIMEALGR